MRLKLLPPTLQASRLTAPVDARKAAKCEQLHSSAAAAVQCQQIETVAPSPFRQHYSCVLTSPSSAYNHSVLLPPRQKILFASHPVRGMAV